MAEFDNENKVEGVFGGVNFEQADSRDAANTGSNINFGENNGQAESSSNIGGTTQVGTISGEIGNSEQNGNTVFKKVEAEGLPIKQSIWTKIKNFLFQEVDLMAPVKVELTPYQQKVEDEINEFLHQEVSFKGFFNLFKKKK